jgi:LmbE family N-acetylglucosaminyl deacetylase
MGVHREDNAATVSVDMADVGTLLGVWAHPDDEAYLSAALMCQARAAGHRVVVATATRGELGTEDQDGWPPERLAAARDEELAASLAAVGVEEHRLLGHRDGGLAAIPLAQGARQVSDLIIEVQPDTIVTFGPEGMTGHPDHQAISRWVSAARAASGSRARLWHATLTPEFHRAWGAVNSEVGLWFTGSEPPSDPADELAHAVHCTGDLLERKFAALAAHRSQTSGLINLVGPQRYRQWWSAEYFVDAAGRPDQSKVA